MTNFAHTPMLDAAASSFNIYPVFPWWLFALGTGLSLVTLGAARSWWGHISRQHYHHPRPAWEWLLFLAALGLVILGIPLIILGGLGFIAIGLGIVTLGLGAHVRIQASYRAHRQARGE